MLTPRLVVGLGGRWLVFSASRRGLVSSLCSWGKCCCCCCCCFSGWSHCRSYHCCCCSGWSHLSESSLLLPPPASIDMFYPSACPVDCCLDCFAALLSRRCCPPSASRDPAVGVALTNQERFKRVSEAYQILQDDGVRYERTNPFFRTEAAPRQRRAAPRAPLSPQPRRRDGMGRDARHPPTRTTAADTSHAGVHADSREKTVRVFCSCRREFPALSQMLWWRGDCPSTLTPDVVVERGLIAPLT